MCISKRATQLDTKRGLIIGLRIVTRKPSPTELQRQQQRRNAISRVPFSIFLPSCHFQSLIWHIKSSSLAGEGKRERESSAAVKCTDNVTESKLTLPCLEEPSRSMILKSKWQFTAVCRWLEMILCFFRFFAAARKTNKEATDDDEDTSKQRTKKKTVLAERQTMNGFRRFMFGIFVLLSRRAAHCDFSQFKKIKWLISWVRPPSDFFVGFLSWLTCSREMWRIILLPEFFFSSLHDWEFAAASMPIACNERDIDRPQPQQPNSSHQSGFI